MCRPDIVWSVNKVARAVTEWTEARDKRLARSISYIHRTFEYMQYCWVGDTAQQCRSGLFQDSDFAGNHEDSKPTSGGILCIFGSLTFVPISWMCKKQTSDSHSSTEAEVISLDAGLRNSRSRSLGFGDWRISFLTKRIQQHQRCKRATVKPRKKKTWLRENPRQKPTVALTSVSVLVPRKELNRHLNTTITWSQMLWGVKSHDQIATTWSNSPSVNWRSSEKWR